MESIAFNKRIAPTADTLINIIDEESVLLNLKSESYFGLDPIGTRMWTALTTAHSIQGAYETLLDEYEVSADVLRHDLTELIEQLISNGLVEIKSE